MRARTRCIWRATASASSRCTCIDDGQRMLFASEIKAFWHVPSVARSSSAIDLEAIHHYLTFNYIPAPWTAYQGVKHVMPGTWMKFTRGAPGGDPALVEPGRPARAGLWFRRLGGGIHGHARRRHAHPPARRRALRRLSVGRRRFEHHRRPDGAPCGPAGQDLLHRLRRPALRRIGVCAAGGAALRLRAHQRNRRAQHAGAVAARAAPPRPAARRCVLHADAAGQRTGGEAREGGADRRRRRRAVCRLRQIRGVFRAARSGFPAGGAFQRRYFDSISLFSPAAKLALYRPEVRRQLDRPRQLHRCRQAVVRRGAALRSRSTRRCTWTCNCC